MQHLVVVVEGISLWIDRGRCWDVLFPETIDPEQQHIPRLEGRADGTMFIPPTSLLGLTLDLTELAHGTEEKFTPSWMIPIESNAHQTPAPGIDVATHAGVVASVRIPKGHLAAASSREPGIVDYGTKHGLVIDFASRWSTSTNAERVEAVLRDRATQNERARIAMHGEGQVVTLLIQNRTQVEHDNPDSIGKSQPGDPLLEVCDVHRLLGMPDEPFAFFRGKAFARDSATPPGAQANAVRVDPDKLCPNCYLI